VTLIDAGPLIALIDKGQRAIHSKCVAAVASLSGSLITTWPCLTEAIYFLGELGGWKGQATLWQYLKDEELFLHTPEIGEDRRIAELMEQDRDTPMDLADASLVSLAELRGHRCVITLDKDFFIYKISGTEAFDVVLISN
jgi:predicted nucleic acid-binding protein